jgi:hypothetical protein
MSATSPTNALLKDGAKTDEVQSCYSGEWSMASLSLRLESSPNPTRPPLPWMLVASARTWQSTFAVVTTQSRYAQYKTCSSRSLTAFPKITACAVSLRPSQSYCPTTTMSGHGSSRTSGHQLSESRTSYTRTKPYNPETCHACIWPPS